MHTIGNVLTTISLQCSLPQFIANIFRNSFLLFSQSIVFDHSLIPLFALSASFLYPTYYPFLIIILESILLHQRRNPCSSFHSCPILSKLPFSLSLSLSLSLSYEWFFYSFPLPSIAKKYSDVQDRVRHRFFERQSRFRRSAISTAKLFWVATIFW